MLSYGLLTAALDCGTLISHVFYCHTFMWIYLLFTLTLVFDPMLCVSVYDCQLLLSKLAQGSTNPNIQWSTKNILEVTPVAAFPFFKPETRIYSCRPKV